MRAALGRRVCERQRAGHLDSSDVKVLYGWNHLVERGRWNERALQRANSTAGAKTCQQKKSDVAGRRSAPRDCALPCRALTCRRCAAGASWSPTLCGSIPFMTQGLKPRSE